MKIRVDFVPKSIKKSVMCLPKLDPIQKLDRIWFQELWETQNPWEKSDPWEKRSKKIREISPTEGSQKRRRRASAAKRLLRARVGEFRVNVSEGA